MSRRRGPLYVASLAGSRPAEVQAVPWSVASCIGTLAVRSRCGIQEASPVDRYRLGDWLRSTFCPVDSQRTSAGLALVSRIDTDWCLSHDPPGDGVQREDTAPKSVVNGQCSRLAIGVGHVVLVVSFRSISIEALRVA